MSELSKEEGVALALWDRFHDITLPRLKSIKEHVDSGAPLSDTELDFLNEIEGRLPQLQAIIDKNEDLQEVFIGATALMKEITDKAVVNEPPPKKEF